ncbi:MAG: thioredoxin domain-containing protein [Bacteroidota bacterium]
MPNRLAMEKSPYLRQHQENPVDWYPWGPEALEKAAREDKPIFLSIGYSACHWCHVMAHECFENPEIADYLNQHFVAIKVDREERPDLDQLYLDAIQTMTGEGGWPLSVFLLPDGRPFFGGTYFPPKSKYGRPGFPEILREAWKSFRTHRDDVEFRADELTDELKHPFEIEPEEPEPALLCQASETLLEQFEPWHGGFGWAPKFPPPMPLEFLLRDWWRRDGEKVQHAIRWTLQKMRLGGIYDQIGGGFHRYSVDMEWGIPHFEKMLTDNALLARSYLQAYQAFGEDDFRRVTEETLLWAIREMRSPEGGFYSSLDADSEGKEGIFYLWSPEEIASLLDAEERKVVFACFGIQETGNFEGKNLPRWAHPPAETAEALGMSPEEMQSILRIARIKLYEARTRRIWPGRDEKIIASWNGLMLKAFADASRALDREEYREIARKNGDFLLDRLVDGDRVFRRFCEGEVGIPGFLEDYANLADGLVSLYEATFEPRWMDAAVRITEAMIEEFFEDGHFWDTGKSTAPLVARPLGIFDNAIPAGTSVACEVLVRLSAYLDREEWKEMALSVLRQLAGEASRTPLAFGRLLSALDLALHPLQELAILGDPCQEETRALFRAASRPYQPDMIVAGGTEPGPVVFLREKKAEVPTAFLCAKQICTPPITDAGELQRALGRP